MIVRSHERGRGQHLHAGLAHREHVRAGAEMFEEGDDVIDIVGEMKRAFAGGHVAGVVPVGDVDVVILQHGLHGVAEQRGEVA